jgi:hypothetical protein
MVLIERKGSDLDDMHPPACLRTLTVTKTVP